MFSMKENHLAHESKADRSNLKFFDPWEHKLAFDHIRTDRLTPPVSDGDRERIAVNDDR